MSEISELVEVGDNLTSLKSPISTTDEFFDAIDDAAKVVVTKDDDDFLKKIEIAISDENPPPAKRARTDEISENGDKIDDELNDSIIEEPSAESLVNGNAKKASENDKHEDDLLKDLEDDQDMEADMEAVGQEVEDLLESVLDDDPKDENKSEEAAKETEKIDDELEDKLLEDDEIVAELELEDKIEETAQKEEEEELKKIEETAKKEEELKKIDEFLENNDEKSEKVDESKVKTSEESSKDHEKPENHTNFDDVPEPKTSAATKESPESETPTIRIPEILQSDAAVKTPDDDDALLVACDSPKESQQTDDIQHDDVSETSSTPDETPEESSDEKVQAGSVEGEKMEIEQEKVEETSDDKMEVDVEKSEKVAAPETDETGEEVLECIVMEETEVADIPKETTPLKLQFMRKFSTAVGKISRPELEEMLVQKITESLMFCSENTELRARLEKKEKNCEAFKKRLDNVVKQYNDLQMIHTRVMKDLKERPDAPITPVKITRAVGLQVYQPVARNKTSVTPSSSMFSMPSKRPNEDSQVNGKSPENTMKKKKRITPLRPGLSETERASLDALEAKEEQKFRTNVSKSISSGPNVVLSSSVNGGQKKSTSSSMASATSIDLTADEESSPPVAKVGPQVVQPPALVAIRGNSQGTSPRAAYVVKSPMMVSANSAAGKLIQYRTGQPDVNRVIPSPRGHPAPLPISAAQISRPGMKKIPPKPAIKINNVANGIIVSWTVETLSAEHAEIHSYQIYAYEETSSPPTSENWRHVGDVKALLLPMAVTLTQFQEGQKYWFAVRAVDVNKRLSHFSTPRTWIEK